MVAARHSPGGRSDGTWPARYRRLRGPPRDGGRTPAAAPGPVGPLAWGHVARGSAAAPPPPPPPPSRGPRRPGRTGQARAARRAGPGLAPSGNAAGCCCGLRSSPCRAPLHLHRQRQRQGDRLLRVPLEVPGREGRRDHLQQQRTARSPASSSDGDEFHHHRPPARSPTPTSTLLRGARRRAQAEDARGPASSSTWLPILLFPVAAHHRLLRLDAAPGPGPDGQHHVHRPVAGEDLLHRAAGHHVRRRRRLRGREAGDHARSSTS